MSITSISRKWPSYASDIRANLIEIFDNPKNKLTLSKHQLYGVSLAVGYSLRSSQLLDLIRNEAKMHLEDYDANACKTASAMVSMNSVLYHFIDSVDDKEITDSIPSFKMEATISSEVDKKDIESYFLAVSILKGCKRCIDYHTQKLLGLGPSKEVIGDIAMIVSVLSATVEVLEIERRRSYEFEVRESMF